MNNVRHGLEVLLQGRAGWAAAFLMGRLLIIAIVVMATISIFLALEPGA